MKRFKMIDEDFICQVCGKNVNHLGYTARDHCPYCLCSLHVDNNPGDRNANCGGILKPVELENGRKDLYKIVYKCKKCGTIKKNIQAIDHSLDVIIKIGNGMY